MKPTLLPMKPTPTPWRIEPAGRKDYYRIVGSNNQVVSIFCGALDMENAELIVTSVNALANAATAVVAD